MDIKVIFEDNDLLVLDKPSGMIVNKSDTTKGEKTVQEWVESYLVIPNSFRDLKHGSREMLKPASPRLDSARLARGEQVQHDTVETDFYKRAGIVHRLDKETSGILLIAKSISAFINLQAQFKERKVQKTYIALAHGKIESMEGEINVAVGRLPWNRKRFGVLSGGRESITKYKVLSIKHPARLASESVAGRYVSGKEKETLTLLELNPKTGRTHQIRVHLQYIHHPIFADPLYGGRKTSRNDRKLLSRVFLHASKISFFHPATKKILSFESLLPEDLNNFLAMLKS